MEKINIFKGIDEKEIEKIIKILNQLYILKIK